MKKKIFKDYQLYLNEIIPSLKYITCYQKNLNIFYVTLIIIVNIFILFLFPIKGGTDSRTTNLHNNKDLKIGLVLSGGGARGAAHVGVLKVLEKYRVPIHYITGTSMGAIVGGLYASGMSPLEMETWLKNANWNEILSDKPERSKRLYREKQKEINYLDLCEFGFNNYSFEIPPAIRTGNKLLFTLRNLTKNVAHIRDFSKLKIPFKACATNLETGELVILDKGDLASAMRASMSIPGVFSPHEMNDQILVDGFLTRNLPVEEVQSMNPDIIIAVDVERELQQKDKLKSAIDNTNQMSIIMGKNDSDHQKVLLKKSKGILIEIPMEGVGSGDFYNSFNIINYGVDAAMAKINQITPLSLIEADYKQYINNHRSNRKCNVPIAFIEMNNAGNKSADMIKKAIKTKPVNGTINFDQLENELLDIAKIYDYEMVDYHLSKNIETNQWGIEVNAKEKSWGPKYINFGLTVESDLKKESNFNLLVLYKKKEQNYLGGESLIHACFGDGRYLSYEFYQPLDAKRNFFITPHLSYSKKAANYRLSDSLEPFSCVNIKEHIGFDFGCRIGDNSEIRAGYLFKRIQYEKYDLWRTNQIFMNKQKHGMLKLQIAFDNLDSAYFPSKGLSFKSYYYYQGKNWGSDVTESGIVFSGILPISFYKNTTVINKLRTKVPLNNASDLPGGTDSLGGFLKISGFEMDSLVGNYYLLYNLIFQRKILELPMVFGKGFYLGASLDAGNIWMNHRAINKDDLIIGTSVFVGAETFLGPIYLAAGFAEYGKSSAYINIGQHF